VELILIFGLKLTEVLSKQGGISVDANACFRKRYYEIRYASSQPALRIMGDEF
jgi:hypothetical protein